MSLLAEIREAAVDGNSDLESLLRKCRVLAARLKHQELANWVNRELDGYSEDGPVPPYRECHGNCYGHLFGFARTLQNCPIPETNFPEQIRDRCTNIKFYKGVAALRSMLQEIPQGQHGTFEFAVPPELYKLIKPKNVAGDFVLAQAWISINRDRVAAILSTIRNKILNFALEIEQEYPDAGEAAPGVVKAPKEFVNQVFHNNFYGPVANVASGQEIQQTSTITIQQGGFRTLAAFLEGQGVEKADIKDLEVAIEEDPKPTGRKFGTRVAAWMGKMVSKAATGAWKVGTDVAAKVLTKALEQHYGLPPAP